MLIAATNRAITIAILIRFIIFLLLCVSALDETLCVFASTETGWPPVGSERIVLKSYRLFDGSTIHQVVSFSFGVNYVDFYVYLRNCQCKDD
jgi:hypothetical protein